MSGLSTRALVPCDAGSDKGPVIAALKPLTRIVDLALPPRCPGCGAVTGEAHRFCAACFQSLRFLGPPWCAGCGVPFSHDRGVNARCADCQRSAPRHAGVRAAVAYGDIARRVALRLKYNRRLALAETMARHMARLVPADADLLVPVPLHRWRLWSRGFNQALLIAEMVSRQSGVAVERDALLRTRATPALKGLGRRQRAKAVKGVFKARRGAGAVLKGKSVVLVDDVHTTGATGDACTAALLRAGAAKVTILCWARVLDESKAM